MKKMSEVFELPVSVSHVDDDVMHELAFGDDRGSNFIIRDCTHWIATTEDHAKHAAHAINHVDALAEALGDLLYKINNGGSIRCTVEIAMLALADYRGEK